MDFLHIKNINSKRLLGHGMTPCSSQEDLNNPTQFKLNTPNLTHYFGASTGFKVRNKVRKNKHAMHPDFDLNKKPSKPSAKNDSLLKTERISYPNSNIVTFPQKRHNKDAPSNSTQSTEALKKIDIAFRDLPAILDLKPENKAPQQNQTSVNKSMMFDFSMIEEGKWNLSKSPSAKEMFPISSYFNSNNFRRKTKTSRVFHLHLESLELPPQTINKGSSTSRQTSLPRDITKLNPTLSNTNRESNYFRFLIPIPKPEAKEPEPKEIKTKRSPKQTSFLIPENKARFFREENREYLPVFDKAVDWTRPVPKVGPSTPTSRGLSPRPPPCSDAFSKLNKVKQERLRTRYEQKGFTPVNDVDQSSEDEFHEYVQQHV